MEHVVTIPADPFPLGDSRVVVHQVPDARDNLVWVLEDTFTSTCAVVDGPGADAVEAFARARGLRVTTILNTHTHPDHVGVNLAYGRLGQLDSLRVVGAASRAADVPGLTEPVREGDEVSFADATFKVIETPGHLDGHICFVTRGAVFCGDTLFAGGCGYLFDGPPRAMYDSLQRLAALPDSTRVCCAHEYTQDNLRFAWMAEPNNFSLAARIKNVWSARTRGLCVVPSSIAEERATNPFLRADSPIIRTQLVQRGLVADTSTDLEVFTATRAWKDRGEHKDLGDARLPLA